MFKHEYFKHKNCEYDKEKLTFEDEIILAETAHIYGNVSFCFALMHSRRVNSSIV